MKTGYVKRFYTSGGIERRLFNLLQGNIKSWVKKVYVKLQIIKRILPEHKVHSPIF